jgi:hypothetical protein
MVPRWCNSGGPPNGCGFTCSRIRLAGTLQDATASGRSTIVARHSAPLLPLTKIYQDGRLPGANQSWAALASRLLPRQSWPLF